MTIDSETGAIASSIDTIYGFAAVDWTLDIARAFPREAAGAGTIWARWGLERRLAVPRYRHPGWGQEYCVEGVEADMKKTVNTGI